VSSDPVQKDVAAACGIGSHCCIPDLSHAACLHAWQPHTSCASRPHAWCPP